jgi:hypothetical protein
MTKWRLGMTVYTLVMLTMTWAYSAEMAIGQIKTLMGAVQVIRNNVDQPAQVGDLLEEADTIATGTNSSVGITFIDNSRFSIGPNSRIALTQFRFNPTTHDGDFLTEMQHGTLAVISGRIASHSPDAMKVRTPTAILGVRGTKFLVQVKE